MPEHHHLAEDSARERLEEAASSMGVSVDTLAIERLDKYVRLIAKWNKVYNLTAVRDSRQMYVQHIYDSLAVVAPLDSHLHGDAQTVLDVGSGAGLPGVVFAITRPQTQVTCIDAVGKKASFVQQVASELRLSNLHARHSRIEQLKEPKADVITSRAFASLSDFVVLTRHLLQPTGVWMALKGKVPDDEIAALPDSVEVFHVEQIKVFDLPAERCIVWMRLLTR